MSDQKKKAESVTPSDKERPRAPEKPPIHKPKVDVAVTPKRGADGAKKYAEKVQKSLEADVKKGIDGAKDGGAKKQLDAAEKVAKDAGKKIDPQRIERVHVTVEGEAGGATIKRHVEVTPQETPPPEKKK